MRRSHPRHRTNRMKLQMESLEVRALLAADLGTSALNLDAADVNQDGNVTAQDAVMVLNAMSIQSSDEQASSPDAALDVNSDGLISALDALMVLNRMQRADNVGPPQGPPLGPGGPHHGGPGPMPGGGPGPNGGGGDFVRSVDGTGNNQRHDDWGAADEQLLRLASVEYADAESAPAGTDRASAREISNLVAAQSEPIENDRGLSDLVWQWGQFLDHDIDLTEGADPVESFPIEVPTGDPYFDPSSTGTEQIDLSRSVYEIDAAGVRQQTNGITAYIDGSNVYGSDEERAAALRTFVDGKLKTSDGDLLPFNVEGLANAGGTSADLFLAGDVRANEQVGLTAMHTLWVREHNRIAEQLADENPNANDEQLYQRARAIVIGEMQAVTYNEFLPALLGEDAMDGYRGYDRRVNAGITNEFSTAAYRFGHSMLSSDLLRLNNDGTVADEGNLALQDAFFSPNEITENGIDSLILGQASQVAQEIDSMLVDDVRNFLFGPPGSGGFDLASLNIQRGRDHGLADYNQVRADLGLEPVDSFEDISSDKVVQAALAAAYETVDDIDLWVGGLAEDHVDGASVGELVHTILVDQFTRLRDGDRFWYERIFSGRELREIDNTTLADVIQRNTDMEALQDNVFFFVPEADEPSNLLAEAGSNKPVVSGTRNELRPSVERVADNVEAGVPADVAIEETETRSRPRRRGPAPAEASVLNAARDAVFATLDTLV